MAGFAIGQRVAIYQKQMVGGTCQVVTVERDTKLYWVAAGRKFRKSDGLEPGSNSGWDRGRYLLPLDDSQVVEAIRAATARAAYGKLEAAQSELAKNRGDFDRINDVKVALEAYAETLQHLDQALEA